MSWLQNLFKPSGQPDFSQLTGQVPTNLLQYDPSQIAPTQASMLGGIGNLGQYNTYGQLLPQAMSIGQGMVGDPSAFGYLSGADTSSALGRQAALSQFGAGANILNTAMDPMNALYQRLYGQTTDASRAGAAAAGLSTSPVGLGATDWAQNMFNIDWQNQLLNRQITGAQAASPLMGGAAPMYLQASGYPWSTGQAIGGANLGTLGALGTFGASASNIPQTQIQDWNQAINTMLGAQAQAFGQQQNRFQDYSGIYNQENAQAQQNYNNMIQGLTGIGGMLGAAAGFGGGMMGGGGGLIPGGMTPSMQMPAPMAGGGGFSNMSPWATLGQGFRNTFGWGQ